MKPGELPCKDCGLPTKVSVESVLGQLESPSETEPLNPLCARCRLKPGSNEELNIPGQVICGIAGTLITFILLSHQLSVLVGQGKVGLSHVGYDTAGLLLLALGFQVAFACLLVRALKKTRKHWLSHKSQTLSHDG